MNILKYILGVSLGLLILIGFEGLVSMGDALKFENYDVISWIAQILAIIVAICLSTVITNDTIKDKTKKEYY